MRRLLLVPLLALALVACTDSEEVSTYRYRVAIGGDFYYTNTPPEWKSDTSICIGQGVGGYDSSHIAWRFDSMCRSYPRIEVIDRGADRNQKR